MQKLFKSFLFVFFLTKESRIVLFHVEHKRILLGIICEQTLRH